MPGNSVEDNNSKTTTRSSSKVSENVLFERGSCSCRLFQMYNCTNVVIVVLSAGNVV